MCGFTLCWAALWVLSVYVGWLPTIILWALNHSPSLEFKLVKKSKDTGILLWSNEEELYSFFSLRSQRALVFHNAWKLCTFQITVVPIYWGLVTPLSASCLWLLHSTTGWSITRGTLICQTKNIYYAVLQDKFGVLWIPGVRHFVLTYSQDVQVNHASHWIFLSVS